jgi:UDP-glucose 4-epimerase
MNFLKVLVTGGAGFIGSHFVDKLASMKIQTVVVDSLYTGRLQNLHAHSSDDGVRFYKGDIRDTVLISKLVRDVDAVVHLAAITSVPFSVQHPVLTNDVNVNGTLNLLRACIDANVQRFVFTSSCAVYGEPHYLPIDEEHPTHPESPYAASKLAAEAYCQAFTKSYNTNITVLRLFNVYGSRQQNSSYAGVITKFTNNLSQGKPLTIYGDGTQTRDFIYVKDVAEAIWLALETQNASGDTFNIGSGVATTINQLINTLAKTLYVKPQITYKSPRPGDLKESYANITKVKKLLKHKPKITLKQGLKKLTLELKNNTYENR